MIKQLRDGKFGFEEFPDVIVCLEKRNNNLFSAF